MFYCKSGNKTKKLSKPMTSRAESRSAVPSGVGRRRLRAPRDKRLLSDALRARRAAPEKGGGRSWSHHLQRPPVRAFMGGRLPEERPEM